MVRTEQVDPEVEKKSWQTPRLTVEGKVSEITAAISATGRGDLGESGPGR
ncbi:MAG: hypothetical protein ACO1SX_18475 [Actinomycetota bacterium]